MQKLVAFSKRKTVWVFLFFIGGIFLSLSEMGPKVLANSSEYDFFNSSPAGEAGGLAIPASCPSDLHDDPTFGQACTNTCGVVGTYQCGGACNAPYPVGYGNSCVSAPNACGATGTGVIGCAGCTGVTPAVPANLGANCTSLPNNCGATNSGTIQCNGSCNAVKPADGACAICNGASGSSCSGTDRWVWQCGCSGSPGPGWIDNSAVAPGCWNKNNGFDAACNPTCGTNGNFCNGTNRINWQCGCTGSPGPGWVDQGGGCYHQNSGAVCSNGFCDGDGICNGTENSCNCPTECTSGTCGFPDVGAFLTPSPWAWTVGAPNFGRDGSSPANAIPQGGHLWVNTGCQSGNFGRMWLFKDPTGPVPIPGNLNAQPNFPSGGINGTQILNGYEWWLYRPAPAPTIHYNPYGGAVPIAYGPHQPGFHRTYADYPATGLTNNVTYRVICWDSVSKNLDYQTRTWYVQGSNRPPVATITSPLAGSTHAVGANITFTGSATDPDAGDTIAAYQWWEGGCGAGVNFGNAASFVSAAFPAGAHTVYFRAQDNRGLWSSCATTTFTVSNFANNLPTAVITQPVTPTPPVVQGTPITFQGLGVDVDGTVVAYEWRQGTLAQCQTRVGGVLLNSGATVGANTVPYIKGDFLPGNHTVYLSVQDNLGAWSNNCPVRLITVNQVAPPAPILGRTCRVDITNGKYYADLSFNAAPIAVRYYVGIDLVSNNTDDNSSGSVDNFNEWYKSFPPDQWLNAYALTTYSMEVIPGEIYFWWAYGENASNVTGPPANGGWFSCSPRTFQVCIDACDSNRPLNNPVAMFDNSAAINLVACFNWAVPPCTVASGDVTNDPLTTWTENLGPTNVATLANGGPVRVLAPINPLAPPLPPWTKSENMRATYGIYSQNWQVDVTKFCVSGCDAGRTANTCAGDSYAAPVDSCGRAETCNGTRTCDFNWKEIAP